MAQGKKRKQSSSSSLATSPQTHDVAGSHLPTLERVQLGSNVEVEVEGLAGLALVLAGVKVDDIVDLGAAAVNDPVVAVERLGVAQEVVDARSRRQGAGVTTEGYEFGAAASVEPCVRKSGSKLDGSCRVRTFPSRGRLPTS